MPLLKRQAQMAFTVISTIFFTSCFDFGRTRQQIEVFPEAYMPVYGIDSTNRIISADKPQPTVTAGKIYVYKNLLCQVEVFKGIHIIDYSNKNAPIKIAFLHIPGCSEVTVKNNIVLTNNMNDLVSLDIGNLPVITELSRVSNAFRMTDFYNPDALDAKPPHSGVHFVCPNAFSGDVVGWTLEKNVSGAYCVTN
jgi:hypothetical protein